MLAEAPIPAVCHKTPALSHRASCRRQHLRHRLVNGTSAATVFVTAALAHLLEARPDLRSGGVNNSAEQTIEDVKTTLMETARPLPGQDGHDDAYGYGIVQIDRLLEAYA